MVAQLENYLVIEESFGMYTSGAKIFSDGTIMHTLFLDLKNNPYISIKCERVQSIIQIFEKDGLMHISVFTKNHLKSTASVDYFIATNSYSFNYKDDSYSDVPLLYTSICHVITNTCTKANVKMISLSETVLTFKELIMLEKFLKSQSKLEIHYGREITTLDTGRYSDITSLENAVIYQLDRMAA